MSGPSSLTGAGSQARQILFRALAGKRTNVERRIRFAKHVAERIWRSWQVGPWQWRLKHLEWYLDVEIGGLKASSRYDHWRAIRTILSGTDRKHLIVCLECRRNNSYLNPSGDSRSRGTGGRKAYLPTRVRRSNVLALST
jgi:hypothetical protein